MQILLIWDMLGEEQVKLYVATGAVADLVAKCDQQYINSSNLPKKAAVLTFQDKYLFDEQGEPRPSHPELVLIEDRSKAIGPFDRIVIAGFIP